MDDTQKKLAAEKIRAFLEARLSRMLGVERDQLPFLKIGTLAHTLFLLAGESESMPGFTTVMSGLSLLIGFDLLWADQKTGEAESESLPKVVVN